MLTLMVNADTVMIVNALSRDSTLRASIVAAAQEAAKQPLPQDGGNASDIVKTLENRINALQLPIGWAADSKDPRSLPSSFGDAVMKLLGLSLTAFAVSLGAPFWFDLLNRLVNLRATGKPPESASAQRKEETRA
jgi:hypothetical protein